MNNKFVITVGELRDYIENIPNNTILCTNSNADEDRGIELEYEDIDEDGERYLWVSTLSEFR